MTNALLFHVASDQAFFSGIALVHLAVLRSLRRGGRWLPVARNVSACVGILLIAVSATPLAAWYYLMAGATFLAWLGAEASSTGAARRWTPRLRLAVLGVWWAGVAMELPYHLPASVPPMGDPMVYVVGDSVSAGLGGEDQTWPRLLALDHQIRVHDLSLAGAKVATALRDEAGRVTGTGGLVILEIGGNDMLGETTTQTFERGLDTLLGRLRWAGNTVVMLELPLPPFDNGYGRAQRRLAARHGAILVPKRVLLGVLLARGATLDTIHLAPSGHRKMAVEMWRVIRGAFETPHASKNRASGPTTHVGRGMKEGPQAMRVIS
jgi:acyl-CoA thioesterase-1